MRPRHPVYIVSKGRAQIAHTPRVLDRLGVPYWLIVEQQELDAYAEHFGHERLLVLPPSFQEGYDTCDELGASKSRGPGPARNFAWEHAIQEGATWHWVMDDNISFFARHHRNEKIIVGDGTIFHAMETFAMRWRNVGMVGPQYDFFVPAREKVKPYITGTRVYSCNLIRNALPFRWRGRYNEDTDLSLRMLKRGWVTVVFNAFVQKKIRTQVLEGGCTTEFYAVEGTRPKSEMLVRLHPDVARMVWRYGRAHHLVDYRRFRSLRLQPDESFTEAPTYRLELMG